MNDFPTGTRGRLSDDVRGALESTADVLRSLGHTVVEGTVDMRPRDVPVILGIMFRAIHEMVDTAERPQRLERRTRAFARPGALVSDRMTERLLAAERVMAERIGSVFDNHDVLLTPVMSTPAVPAGIMEGRGAIATYNWETGWVPFTILWNITGQPAASVPAGICRRWPATRGAAGRPPRRRAHPALARRRARGRAALDRPPAPGRVAMLSDLSAAIYGTDDRRERCSPPSRQTARPTRRPSSRWLITMLDLLARPLVCRVRLRSPE